MRVTRRRPAGKTRRHGRGPTPAGVGPWLSRRVFHPGCRSRVDTRAFKLHVNSRPAPPSQSAARRGVKSDKGNGHFVKSHDARGDGRGRGVPTGGLRLPAAPAPPAPLRRAEGVARGRLYEPLIRLERWKRAICGGFRRCSARGANGTIYCPDTVNRNAVSLLVYRLFYTAVKRQKVVSASKQILPFAFAEQCIGPPTPRWIIIIKRSLMNH